MHKPILIGCSLNFSSLKQILKNHANFCEKIEKVAEKDIKSHADFLNVNVDAFKNSPKRYCFFVKRFFSKHNIGLSIESKNYKTMLKFAQVHSKNIFLNSILGSDNKTEELECLLHFAKENGSNLIVMPYSKSYPRDALGRIKLSEKICKLVSDSGFNPSKIYIDVVALPIKYAPEQYYEMLLSIALIKKLSCFKTVVGLENLVYNLEGNFAKKKIKIFAFDVIEKGIDAILLYRYLKELNQVLEVSRKCLEKGIY